MKTFSEWLKLKELATTTASIATVPMKLGLGPVRRSSLMLGGEFIYRKKRKPKMPE